MTRKSETKLKKTEKTWKKKITQMKVISVKMRYQILTLLKPFEFGPNTNIKDINCSNSDDEDK